MCEEYRLFFWKRQLLIASHYHRQTENPVDWSPFVNLAQRFDAPFFTMDVAQTEAGNWIVVDMGAGECSSLPPSLEPTRFYSKLAEMDGNRSCVRPYNFSAPHEPFRLFRVSSFMDTNLLDRMLRLARDSSPGLAIAARMPPTFVRGSGSSCRCHASPSKRRKSCGTSL